MIKYSAGDYIIVGRIKGKRALLVGGKRIDDQRGQGILESSRVTGDDTVVDFETIDVVANLGPAPGTCAVMGVKVEPWFKSFTHSLGAVDFYYPVKKSFKAKLDAVLTECEYSWKELKKVSSLCSFQFEVRQPKSPKSIHGYYKGFGGREEVDLIVINADVDQEPLLPHLIHHEFGHAIWHHRFTDGLRASWIEMYASATDTTMVTGKDSRRLYDSWIKSEDTIDVWLSAQEEEDQDAYNNLISNIGSTFGLRARDIEILRTKARTDTLDLIWPESVLVGDMKELITPYSKKSSEELFCEAFAVYMTGHKLPASVEPLMLRTVKWLKS